MTRNTTDAERQKALETVSEMIEEIWGGLTLLTADDGKNEDAHQAMLRGLLRIADDGRSKVEIALGNSYPASSARSAPRDRRS